MFDDDSYDMAAGGATKYEDAAFDLSLGNWIDFRTESGPEGYFLLRAQTAWCHGAGGIGLARIRRRDHLGVDRALAAVEAQLASVPSGSSLGLCHGTSGLIEVLSTAARAGYGDLLGRDPSDRLEELWDTLDLGDLPGLLRSTGLSKVGLMDGVSGVGYQALRLADPDRTPALLSLALSHDGANPAEASVA